MSWQTIINAYNHKAIGELEYISKCLDFVEEKISKENQLISVEYDEALKKELSEGQIPDALHDYFYDKNFHFDSISKTIIEAIVIRQISVVEKHFVEMSFFVYKKLTKDQNVILPPHCNCSDQDHFSDSIKAVAFIEEQLNLKIKNDLNNVWKPFQLIRKHLRNKLAHGENTFLLTNEQVNEINRIFENNLLEFQFEHYVKEGDKNYKKSLEKLETMEQDNSTEDGFDFDADPNPVIVDRICSYYKIRTDYSVLKELNSKLRALIIESTQVILANLK